MPDADNYTLNQPSGECHETQETNDDRDLAPIIGIPLKASGSVFVFRDKALTEQ